MSGFKLIAIRPLEGCNTKFLKVLKAGEIYQFYNDYHFKFNNDGKKKEVVSIEYIPTVPDNLYDVGDLKVNISAIVGKNGSGKSSLLELLFLATYKIGIELNFIDNIGKYKSKINKTIEPKIAAITTKILKYENELRYIKSERSNLKNQIVDDLIEELDILIKESKSTKITLEKEKWDAEKHQSEIKEINEKFNIELYYSIDDYLYVVKITQGKITQFQIPFSKDKIDLDSKSILFEISNKTTIVDKFDLTKFFYSIVLNYSSYGLNSLIIGTWIDTLFHKNDGYKTPLVLNPMRKEGNFDINDENEFAKYRLLNNLLVEKKAKAEGEKIYVTDNQYVSKIRFTYDNIYKESREITNISSNRISGTPRATKLVEDLKGLFLDSIYVEAESLIDEIPFNQAIHGYIVAKIDKISKNYREYKQGYRFDSPIQNTDFLKRLEKDKSHITFKLRQAINFLKKGSKELPGTFKWKQLQETFSQEKYIEFTLDELLDWVGEKVPAEEIINHLPPSIFSIDIVLSNESNTLLDSKEPTFNGLSSGEQQLIHSIQSIIYHLNNLQSVHKAGDNRVAHSAVNIIFDEIELYFHPDYQRKFISVLLKSIERFNLGGKKGINTINILFSTHSPFILSDIPTQNILFLELNDDKYSLSKKVDALTFGANIHDLLSHSFFMESTIGELANNKIKEILDLFYKVKLANKEELKTLKVEYLKNKTNFEFIISNIGEDLIRNILRNHVDFLNETFINPSK